MNTLTTDITKLIEKGIQNGQSYQEFRELVSTLVAEGKTTGAEQGEDLVNYTLLNDRRMKRWDKTVKITEEAGAIFKKTTQNLTWIVLTESWCGDAAHNIPVLQKIAELAPNIEMKVVLREENEALMDHFLTNGGRAIPKLVAYDTASKEVKYTWGPRPNEAAQMVNDYKAAHGKLDPEIKEDLQKWYNKNKGQAVIADFLTLLAQ